MFGPLNFISEKITEIAGGDYGQRINSKKQDEIGELSNNVDEMAKAIQERIIMIERESENRRIFIDDLSHELKTPLTTIMGYGDLLRIKPDISEEEKRKYGGLIVSETNRLKMLSDKLMQLINVENMNKDSFVKVKLKKLLGELKLAFLPQMQTKNLSLILDCDQSEAVIDQDLFKSMVGNMIDNAIKASRDKGIIRISCKTDNKGLSICVEDNGIGIPQNELEKILEPFYMVDKSRSRKSGGAGIGLALCNKIAQAHRGRITIESVENKGTKVYFTSP